MKFTNEIYYQLPNGSPKTASLPEFDARNLNHAIRRMVKTITNTAKYGMHTRFNLWADDGQSVHVYVNQVMGQYAGVTVNDVFYPAHNWVESFQG